jgi:hypothetical protein
VLVLTLSQKIANKTYVIVALKTYQRTIWDYKRGDYTLMKQKIIDTNWEKLINDELDVNNACSNFTYAFLTIAKECIPTLKWSVL